MQRAINVFEKTRDFVDLRKKLIQLKVRAFEPKVRFHKEIGEFVIKTAETKEELQAILKLRYDVFIEEGLKKKKFVKIDFDRYDLLADHVIVQHKESGLVIGTYRLLCTLFTHEFYSENEFDLSLFLKSPGVKLELGRACIHKDYRNGVSINLVWKGLGAYAKEVGADYMFGCASVKTIDPRLSCSLHQSLVEHQSNEYSIHPTQKFMFKMKDFRPSLFSQDYLDAQVPSLLKSYIKAGAKVHGIPAVDYDFDCIDIMTILNLHTIDARYKARYLSEKN